MYVELEYLLTQLTELIIWAGHMLSVCVSVWMWARVAQTVAIAHRRVIFYAQTK